MSIEHGSTNRQRMSKLRSAVFPVHNVELSKFAPLCLLIFLTTFVHHLLRVFKEPFLVTATGSGPEVLSFVKLYLVLPGTIGATMFYVRMRRTLTIESCYQYALWFFVLFFFAFNYLLLPYMPWLHPSADVVLGYKQSYPVFYWFFTMWENWGYCLYYVGAELWGIFMLSVLFWQLANDSICLEKAGRFYPLFITISNVSLLMINPLVAYLSTGDMHAMAAVNVIILGVLVLMLVVFYIWQYRCADGIDDESTQQSQTAPPPIRQGASFSQGIKIMADSKYIRYISFMVMFYAMTITVMEATWKSYVVRLYPSTNEYMTFIATYSTYTGIVTIVVNYFGKNLIRTLGWTVGAIITPLIFGFCALLFYLLIFADSYFAGVWFAQEMLLSWTVSVGAATVMLSRSAKYSFFDPTKEMAFIPLDKQTRMYGKAVADGMGNRLGKSLAGLLVSTMLMMMGGNVYQWSLPLGVVVVLLSVLWFRYSLRLGRLYSEKVATQSAQVVV